MLHPGYTQPLHAGSVDISLPGSQLLQAQAVSLASFFKRQKTALNRSHNLCLAPNYPAPRPRRRERFQGEAFAQRPDYESWPEFLVLKHRAVLCRPRIKIALLAMSATGSFTDLAIRRNWGGKRTLRSRHSDAVRRGEAAVEQRHRNDLTARTGLQCIDFMRQLRR